MLRALTPEIRANSSNRYSANAMHPDYATGALRLCTATMHATTVPSNDVCEQTFERCDAVC